MTMELVAALLIGVIAGLRSLLAPALVAWAARFGWLGPVGATPLSFMTMALTPWLFTLLAAGELIMDKLPTTPSRTVPLGVIGRVLGGGLAGATIGAGAGMLAAGLGAGVIGALIGTYGGAAGRRWLARVLHHDTPAAIIEDVVALWAGLMIVAYG